FMLFLRTLPCAVPDKTGVALLPPPQTVPAGDEWHQIKIDGFCVQIHKLGNEGELYSRSGSRSSGRYQGCVGCYNPAPGKSCAIPSSGRKDERPLFPRLITGSHLLGKTTSPSFHPFPLPLGRAAIVPAIELVFGGKERNALLPEPRLALKEIDYLLL